MVCLHGHASQCGVAVIHGHADDVWAITCQTHSVQGGAGAHATQVEFVGLHHDTVQASVFTDDPGAALLAECGTPDCLPQHAWG